MDELKASLKGKRCRVTKSSPYFLKKYGTATPEIEVEDVDQVLFGGSWMHQNGNIACMLYGMRSGLEGLPLAGTVYYGKIKGSGELVHESELKVI